MTRNAAAKAASEWLEDHRAELRARYDTAMQDAPVVWDDLFRAQNALNSLPHFVDRRATISKTAELVGPVIVSEGCRIMPGAFIEGPAYLGPGSFVGNNALVRSGSFLSEKSIIGHDCYCTAAFLRPKSGVFHFSGISRSMLGRGSRLGSHIVTETTKADYSPPHHAIQSPFSDGKKLGCIIGDATCLTSFISVSAGIVVGSNCLIGPHTHLSEDVPDNSYIETVVEKRRIRNNRKTAGFPDPPNVNFLDENGK